MSGHRYCSCYDRFPVYFSVSAIDFHADFSHQFAIGFVVNLVPGFLDPLIRTVPQRFFDVRNQILDVVADLLDSRLEELHQGRHEPGLFLRRQHAHARRRPRRARSRDRGQGKRTRPPHRG